MEPAKFRRLGGVLFMDGELVFLQPRRGRPWIVDSSGVGALPIGARVIIEGIQPDHASRWIRANRVQPLINDAAASTPIAGIGV